MTSFLKLRAAEDPEFETFYTKHLLNEGIRMWMQLRINHMKTIYSQRRYCHVETRFDDLEITTDKTIESTGFAWAGNARLINLSGKF
jgi:hypothetical protein